MKRSRLSLSRTAVSTRPSGLRDGARQHQRAGQRRQRAPVQRGARARRRDVVARMRLKSVKPLLPPKPVSLRKNNSMAAKVSACVMMEKYTPLMRERKAK